MVWSLFTRILHWTVAVPVLLNFFLDGEDDPHKIAGYLAASAVTLRLGWGFVTKDKAHFRHFPLAPSSVNEFIRSSIRGEKDQFDGHNPLASWVYILMWISVLALGVSGFMMGMDKFWGEEWLEETHGAIATGLKFLVAFHFTGLIADSVRFKRPTWRGMITGKK